MANDYLELLLSIVLMQIATCKARQTILHIRIYEQLIFPCFTPLKWLQRFSKDEDQWQLKRMLANDEYGHPL